MKIKMQKIKKAVPVPKKQYIKKRWGWRHFAGIYRGCW